MNCWPRRIAKDKMAILRPRYRLEMVDALVANWIFGFATLKHVAIVEGDLPCASSYPGRFWF